MSKIVVSLPKGAVKYSLQGAVLALASYVAMQFLWALLIDRGVMGFELLYPAVCISAAIAAFFGCLYSASRGGRGDALSVASVIAVFLAVTVAAGLMSAEGLAVERGLTGVGLSMAAGGLAAALVGINLTGRGRGGKGKRKRRRQR